MEARIRAQLEVNCLVATAKITFKWYNNVVATNVADWNPFLHIDLSLSYRIPRTLGPFNVFFSSAQRLDLFAWCVRPSRLLVGFRTHLKNQRTFISLKYTVRFEYEKNIKHIVRIRNRSRQLSLPVLSWLIGFYECILCPCRCLHDMTLKSTWVETDVISWRQLVAWEHI